MGPCSSRFWTRNDPLGSLFLTFLDHVGPSLCTPIVTFRKRRSPPGSLIVMIWIGRGWHPTTHLAEMAADQRRGWNGLAAICLDHCALWIVIRASGGATKLVRTLYIVWFECITRCRKIRSAENDRTRRDSDLQCCLWCHFSCPKHQKFHRGLLIILNMISQGGKLAKNT